jgi:predicted acyl esterase
MEVGNTASIFRQGHRVRVEISSSNFPKFGRNLNTTAQGDLQSQIVVAKQTILHDWLHASYIQLPVAPGVQIP